MTGFDLEIARRVCAYLAGQDAYIEAPTLFDLELTLLTYPELRDIIPDSGFQKWGEAWDWIYYRLEQHRVLMGMVSACANRRRFAMTEDDGA
jgi:hypothetical protein